MREEPSTSASAQVRLRLPYSFRSLLPLLLLLSLMPCAFAQNSAAFVSQSVPTAMQTGQTYSASVTVKNTGNTAWVGGSCSLASANTQTWGTTQVKTFGTTQVTSPLAVAPGGQVTFAFLVEAPSAGSYSFSWNMTQGGSTLISPTPAVAVTVTDPAIQFTPIIQGTSAAVPSHYTPGFLPTARIWEVDGSGGGGVVATSDTPNGWSVTPNSPQQLGIYAPAGAVAGGGYAAFWGAYIRQQNSDNPWEYNANFSVVGPPSAGAVGPLGPAYPWQAGVGGVNTANGNKLFSVPVVGWPVRGGMSVGVTLYQNSESTITFPTHIGNKWSCNYDAWLTQTGSGPVMVQWGDGQSYTFAPDGLGGFNPPKGIYDTLSPSGSDYNLVTKSQVHYHFKSWTTSGGVTTYYLDGITDEHGNRIAINRDYGSARIQTVQGPTGRTLTFGYDFSHDSHSGWLNSISDGTRLWWMEFQGTDSSSYNLYKLHWPGVTVQGSAQYPFIQFGYDASHNVNTLKDLNGNTSQYAYNNGSSLGKQWDPYLNGLAFNYSDPNNVKATDDNQHSTTYGYTNGLLTSVTDALNNAERYTYDANNNLTQETDKRGNLWKYSVDARKGNPNTSTDPVGNTSYAVYDPRNNKVISSQDAMGNTSISVYDLSGVNLLSVTDSLGRTATFGYDSYGSMTDVWDALGHNTHTDYDANEFPQKVTDANGNYTSPVYNDVGFETSSTDMLGHKTTRTPDEWYRVTQVSDPDGHSSSMVYDANSNVLSATDANNHTTVNTYDADNCLLTTQKANGDKVSYTYDQTGPHGESQHNLLSWKTDGNGHQTRYDYTARNEPYHNYYADGNSENWQYDPNGNMTAYIEPTGSIISYQYYANNLLQQILYQNNSVNANVGFVYDADNRRIQMTDGIGTTTWAYGDYVHLTQLSAPYNSVSYGYDNLDRRTSMTEGGGIGTWTYNYDNGNRLSSTGNPYGELTQLIYNNDNTLHKQFSGNGTSTIFSYDGEGRPLEAWHGNSNGNQIADDYWNYDPVGNLQSKHAADGSQTTYGYDGANQLQSEVRTGPNAYSLSYDYDHNSNRLHKTLNGQTDTYAYLPNSDKLQSVSGSWGSKVYGYDANGTIRTVNTNGSVNTLNTDYNCLPFSINYSNGATDHYAYNGLSQRVYYQDGGGNTHYNSFDGASPGAALLSDSAAVYTLGLSERRGGQSLFYQTDLLGTNRRMTNGSQAQTDALLYDAFGGLVSHSGSTTTPFGFGGGATYQTDTSGLLLLGYRYYDPSIGRFLSADPAGDGDNWYAYVGNNPLVEVDPEGLHKIWPALPRPDGVSPDGQLLYPPGMYSLENGIEVRVDPDGRSMALGYGTGHITYHRPPFGGETSANFIDRNVTGLAAGFYAGGEQYRNRGSDHGTHVHRVSDNGRFNRDGVRIKGGTNEYPHESGETIPRRHMKEFKRGFDQTFPEQQDAFTRWLVNSSNADLVGLSIVGGAVVVGSYFIPGLPEAVAPLVPALAP